jgi:hypothetical protein
MLLFHHAGKMSSIPPPAGGLSAAIVVVARRWKEYHVIAAVEGHELKTPETEHRPGPERLLKTAHLELDGKLFVSTQQAPTWRANCRRFETGGSLSRRVSVLRRAGRSGIPENSGRVVRVFKNSGIQQLNPNSTRYYLIPEISGTRNFGFGFGLTEIPDILPRQSVLLGSWLLHCSCRSSVCFTIVPLPPAVQSCTGIVVLLLQSVGGDARAGTGRHADGQLVGDDAQAAACR